MAVGTSPPRRVKRYRRPSGEPPPLPRSSHWNRWLLLAIGLFVIGLLIATYVRREGGLLHFDRSALGWSTKFRTHLTVDTARDLNVLAGTWEIFALRAIVLAVLGGERRWRLFAVALFAFAASDLIAALLRVKLPPPTVVVLSTPTLARVSGFYFPAPAAVAMSVTLFTGCRAILPKGRPRRIGLTISSIVLVSVGSPGSCSRRATSWPASTASRSERPSRTCRSKAWLRRSRSP